MNLMLRDLLKRGEWPQFLRARAWRMVRQRTVKSTIRVRLDVPMRVTRVVGVIRAPSPQAALSSAWAVAEGGISLLEITFTVPDAPRVMAELSGRADVVVGAGTVLTAAQAHAAIAAGARFIVAPNLSREV